MSKLAITHEDDVEPERGLPFATEWSGVTGCRTLSPESYPLRMSVVDLAAGGVVRWGADHGDEGLYVLDGLLEVEGRPCEGSCATIIESGAPITVTAARPTRFLRYGRSDNAAPEGGLYGSPAPDGHSYHVVGPNGWFRCEHGEFRGVVSTWYADSTCPTCRITLMRVEHPHNFSGPAHSHSQDEIIYVLDGSVRLGKHEYFRGTALCIPANIRYRVTYPNGGDFLNYRPDVSQTQLPGDIPPRLEGGLAGGGVLVGDLR